MKRALHVILALAIVSMFMISPVAAATSQGLEWGVATGDQFDFTMVSTGGGDDDINEGMFMNVTDMPALAIPDPVGNWMTIPHPDIGMYWDNGTSLGFYAIVFILLLAVGSRMIVPIGNYTYLTALIAPALMGEDIIDTLTIWGVEWTQELNATHEYTLTATYNKADGFLAEFSYATLLSSNENVIESFSVTRDGLAGDLDIVGLLQDNIIIVAAAVGVLIVLAIVCKKK